MSLRKVSGGSPSRSSPSWLLLASGCPSFHAICAVPLPASPQLTARPVRRREPLYARRINVCGNSATRVPVPARTGRKWPPRKTNHPRNRRAGQNAGSGPPRGPARGDGGWGTHRGRGEREERSLTTRSGSCPALASGRRGI